MKADLIYDVGFFNGDDTDYYLYKGFRVVAIEANPRLAAEGSQRFETQIAADRLTILNVGIAEAEGTFSFWVNEHSDGWSSFDKAVASRLGTKCHEVKVRAMPLSAILREYGVPFYLKADIEGSDGLCVRSLDPDDLPQYVSCEINHDEDIVGKLYDAGYRRFKVLNQATYTGSIPTFKGDLAARLMRKSYLKLPPFRYLVNSLPLSLRPKRIDLDDFPARFKYKFSQLSSGPFGEETHGPWYSRDKITRRIAYIEGKYLKAGLPLESVWYDVHATR